ncbi:uncharacterized protein [Gossypium hirsutum]|uniref:RNA-directed DNA polymerase homolog n=1 Tax=Gossypium hirsutum TaxID=3635 RepID=A0ABM3A7C5_GOSHI|nr:uncharacterized protein LOC121218128 [Gossypium hirsutum]
MPTKLPKKLPSKREVDHMIELVPNMEPPTRTPYCMSLPGLEELRKWLMELLDAGFVRPSKSPFSVPCEMVHQVGLQIWVTSSSNSQEGRAKDSLCDVSLEEHVEHLREAFQTLRENGLFFKDEKCSFSQLEVSFLCHIVGGGKIRMDERKIRAIVEWEPQTKVIELRSFLGLVNYYRQFIKGSSKITAPLTNMLKKGKV